jgi:ribonuclease P protein component
MKLVTLKVRRDFLRLRGGARWSCSNFILETKPRSEVLDKKGCPRFGFTVTTALGGAVERNFIRRRLKSAVQALADGAAKPNHDYVVVARAAAGRCSFAELQKDLEQALERVHQPRGDSRHGRNKPRLSN